MIVENDVSNGNIENRKELERGGKLHWIHWTVIALSLFATVAVWYFSKEQLAQKNMERFDREAERVVALVKERMELYENALRGAVALIDTHHGEISLNQWQSYANSLQLRRAYPGVNGIGVVYNIRQSELDHYLLSQRTERPNFKIHPTHTQIEYWPITYIEPISINSKALGLDIAFETNRYNGVKKARDTGTPQVTGPITLVQDSQQTPGFLFYAPFYQNGNKPDTLGERREKIVGVTYAPFIMYKLMQGTLATQNRHVLIEIRDQGTLLYEDPKTGIGNDSDPDPMFSQKIRVEMYGRIWSFDIWASAEFRQGSSANTPFWILVGGLIIDGMLFILFVFLTKISRKALAHADKMTEELTEKSRKLEASSEVKSTFLANMSHELRTPLAGVIGLTELLLDSDLADYQQKWGDRILSSSHTLLVLLNGILDQSKLEAGKLELHLADIHLGSLIQTNCDLFSSAINAKGLSLNIELDEQLPKGIHADGMRIGQILTNFISNAVKFTHKGSIAVKVSHQQVNANDIMLTISVADTGIGLPLSAQGKLFLPFNQADNSTSKNFGGTGLGLSISKQLAELMGGDVGLESIEGLGSRFWLTLKCQANSTPITANEQRRTIDCWQASKSLKILVAEDIAINREIVAAMLAKFNHITTFAANGKEAIECVEKATFDLILMDIRMPVMDGIDAIAAIRALKGEKSKIPIIALTADVTTDNVKEYTAVGAYAVCAKPIDLPSLLKGINDVLHEEIHTIVPSNSRTTETFLKAKHYPPEGNGPPHQK